MTHTVEISVGGPAYGSSFAAYAKCDSLPWLSREPVVVGLAESPEAASTQGQAMVRMQAKREGLDVAFVFPR